MNEPDEFYEAGRLIQWALQPDARPINNPEYHQLLNRYLDFLSFRAIVKSIATGLGLEVVGEDLRGLVLVPTAMSIFAMKPSEYPTSSTADDRLINGLIQVAIIATVFPRAQDLEEDPTIARPPISIDEVESTLREICERLEVESRDRPDPSVIDRAAGLDEAWRIYHSRADVKKTPRDRKSSKVTRTLIENGLEFLQVQGCFQLRNGKYQPNWRYRVMVQQFTATQIYKAVCNILEPERS
jgi:hypothetical protein